MIKTFLFSFMNINCRLALFLILFILNFNPVYAVPADTRPVRMFQPSGFQFDGFQKGDEWQNWFETSAGFTILKNENNVWTYAVRGVSGSLNLGPENVTESNMDIGPADRGIPKHLKPPREIALDESPVPNIASSSRTDYLVPLLLIDYPDALNQYTVQNFDDLMNLADYNSTGSFKDYYEEVSYNQFHPVTTVMGWYTASNYHDYYANSGSSSTMRAAALVREAVDSAEAAGLDFSQFDNDGDGYVDALNVVHGGHGAEQGDLSNIWSHKYWLSAGGLSVQYDGVWIDAYTINPEMQSSAQTNIGVIAHEFGHAVGLPDLYDTDGSSSGAGNWSLMAGGAWGGNGSSPQYPSHMTPWSKDALDWLNPVTITADTTGVQIPPIENSAVAYRLNHPMEDGEYFLVEHRNQQGFDQTLVEGGILIWHLDSTVIANNWNSNSVNNNEPHFGVALEQADGDNDLENDSNSGDTGDPFPGSTSNTAFDDNSNPNSHSHDLLPSFISVSNISISDTFALADFDPGQVASVASASISADTATAWDTSTVVIRVTNTFELGSFECVIMDDPDKLKIVGATASSRAQGMTVSFEEQGDGTAKISLTGGTVSAGEDTLLLLDFFAETSVSQSIDLTLSDADAVDSSGSAVAITVGNTEVYVMADTQKIIAKEASALPGETALIPVYMSNTIQVGKILMHLRDTPNVFTLFEEPYTDANNNSEWDSTEIYEDTNGDGMWTGMVTFSDRVTGSWTKTITEFNGRVMVIMTNWNTPIQADTTLLMKINVLVDSTASPGAVVLDFPTLGLKALEDESYMTSSGSGEDFIISQEASTEDELSIPDAFALLPNYPNPFNNTTTIRFQIGVGAVPELPLQLHIYDIAGRLVATLINSVVSPGLHEIVWNANRHSSGMYFIRLKHGNFQQIQKMILLK